MPERAAEQFERSVHDLDLIVDELLDSRRRGRVLISLVIAGLLGGGAFTVYALDVLNDNQITTCRDGNARFDRLMNFLETRITTSPEGREFVAGMRAASIVDCDDDSDASDDIPRTQE